MFRYVFLTFLVLQAMQSQCTHPILICMVHIMSNIVIFHKMCFTVRFLTTFNSALVLFLSGSLAKFTSFSLVSLEVKTARNCLKFSLRRANFYGLNSTLAPISWNNRLSNSTYDQALAIFYNILFHLLSCYVPSSPT